MPNSVFAKGQSGTMLLRTQECDASDSSECVISTDKRQSRNILESSNTAAVRCLSDQASYPPKLPAHWSLQSTLGRSAERTASWLRAIQEYIMHVRWTFSRRFLQSARRLPSSAIETLRWSTRRPVGGNGWTTAQRWMQSDRLKAAPRTHC